MRVRGPAITGGPGGGGQRRRGADDMDVGSLQYRGGKGDHKGGNQPKGKGHGGGKGKGDAKGKRGDAPTCWNCGKKGHKSDNCWQKSNPKGDSKGGKGRG
eukprot:771207-Pyramimonas_sp.AAC.1